MFVIKKFFIQISYKNTLFYKNLIHSLKVQKFQNHNWLK